MEEHASKPAIISCFFIILSGNGDEKFGWYLNRFQGWRKQMPVMWCLPALLCLDIERCL
jgi:hypothetical protein